MCRWIKHKVTKIILNNFENERFYFKILTDKRERKRNSFKNN